MLCTEVISFRHVYQSIGCVIVRARSLTDGYMWVWSLTGGHVLVELRWKP